MVWRRGASARHSSRDLVPPEIGRVADPLLNQSEESIQAI
jgi:hypothetical protein